jgi:hypothetical protein
MKSIKMLVHMEFGMDKGCTTLRGFTISPYVVFKYHIFSYHFHFELFEMTQFFSNFFTIKIQNYKMKVFAITLSQVLTT